LNYKNFMKTIFELSGRLNASQCLNYVENMQEDRLAAYIKKDKK